jgi:hypothetical protein
MGENDRRPLKAAFLGLALTAMLYGAAAAAFFAMLWTLFQLIMWAFGGG